MSLNINSAIPPNPQDQRAGHPAPMHDVVGRTEPEQDHV